MGASDSKLVFKQGIFRLSEDRSIPANDTYWTGFWELPESTEDVFSLFSPVDIRRTRDTSIANLETLLLAVTSRLFNLAAHPSFPDSETAPEKDALNCIRILTRLLPFIYEADHLEVWEDNFFWSSRRRRSTRSQTVGTEILFDGTEAEDNPLPRDTEEESERSKPLGEELIDTLTDLLFHSGFTLPTPHNARSKVTYSIWQSGVGCNTAVGSTKEFESNRCEILRLLLTLTSKSMYMTPNILPVKGVKAITYITTCPDKQIVLSVLCSLLNTTLKYNPASWRVPYDHVVFKDPKQILVTYCLQLLLVLILYPIPENSYGQTPKNNYRHFLGRLHRPQDFQFLVEGMTRSIASTSNKSYIKVHANSSYLPGSQKSLKWAPEMIMLFWEVLQCNKRFRSFIIDTNRAHDFVVLILFYALAQKTDPSKQGVVRMCIFVLQTLSVEPTFGKSLNKQFEGQESLPTSVRVPNFNGTYADYLIISVYTLITASKGKLDAIYPALLAIMKNIAAYVEHISTSASSKLLQLFASMSSPGFLLANETNHALLQSLLESINAVIEHRYSENPNLIFTILRGRKRFEALRSFTLETGQEEIERQERLRKEQASETQLNSSPVRANSAESLRSPSNTHARTPTLSNVPEENSAFAIGDDDDSEVEDDHRPTPSQSSPSMHDSRTPSVSSSIDDTMPLQLRGMSEKARGKMPAGQPSFSRQNSTNSLSSHGAAVLSSSTGFMPTPQWIETWLPELPLHTILTLISELSPQVSLPSTSSPDFHASLDVIRDAQIRGIDPSPVRVHLFEWSTLSLGWYESLLWGFIFASEMVVSKGTVGVWNGTVIRLFKVQETAAEGPSFLAPRGAVDAVGSNLVQRIGSLNIRGNQSGLEGQNRQGDGGVNGIATVSSRYLELTRKKLELTRLPHEITLPQHRAWEYGTPKSDLEPLVDFWLEEYDWRTQESIINNSLPQFRTTITIPPHPPLRVHFVHSRSSHPDAIPLLFCHGWPGSILEVLKILGPLTDPTETHTNAAPVQAFHVVAPSIPGFGFSDPSPNEGMGLLATAAMYDALMQRLGYRYYVAQGGDCGANICRMLAIHYAQTCLATHVNCLSVRPPSWTYRPLVYLKYRIAEITRCRIPSLSFGYIPSDVEASEENPRFNDEEMDYLALQQTKPQTIAYALCDSPVGLLAYIREKLHDWTDNYAWTPIEILNFVMMHWLPGLEAGLRWHREALRDMQDVREKWSSTPMGISAFKGEGSRYPPMWGKCVQNLRWVRRHDGGGRFAAWERPEALVGDLRDYFGEVSRMERRLGRMVEEV
ncbi:MAG: hypothetical protein M1812_000315 [Candelaria pacifica]|nr:MAG: hypothetical protein M1812_000315 [Candelaria pacifica]